MLIKKANIHKDDIERKTLFYIISGNNDLSIKQDFIYDFNENFINLDTLNSKDIDFCSSSKSLIRLGFNLYNGYSDDYTNPLCLLQNLDSKNYILANNAINMRFDR